MHPIEVFKSSLTSKNIIGIIMYKILAEISQNKLIYKILFLFSEKYLIMYNHEIVDTIDANIPSEYASNGLVIKYSQ